MARRPAPPDKPLISVDVFDVERGEGRRRLLRLGGWAVDPVSARTAAGILVQVAGTVTWLPTGLRRQDVAEHFREPGYERSGYGGLVDLGRLPPGVHEVVVNVVASDGRGYYETSFRRAIPDDPPGPPARPSAPQ
jgi:hypothetical protein